MATADRADAIAALLTETESAHGVYEASVLNGIYDQDWPQWYAQYAVEHGMGDAIGHPVSAEELATFLERAFAEFKGLEPAPVDGWAAYVARKMAAEL
jgi:hypothetical protein